jgi:hypothetical protein
MTKRTRLPKVILNIVFFTHHIIPAESPSPVVDTAFGGRTATCVSSARYVNSRILLQVHLSCINESKWASDERIEKD